MSQSLTVDLSNPTVRQMLGMDPRPTLHGHARHREVVRIAGDADRGISSTTRLTAGRYEVIVRYGDMFMTVDLYRAPSAPWIAHLYCPRCHKHSTVRGEQKAIDYEPTAGNPMRAAILATGNPELAVLADFGRLSIAAFECPWEVGDDRHVAGGVHTGASLCRLRLAIDNNRALEA